MSIVRYKFKMYICALRYVLNVEITMKQPMEQVKITMKQQLYEGNAFCAHVHSVHMN
jgi:hypothetical protein